MPQSSFECIAELTRKKGNTQEGKDGMTRQSNSQPPRLRLPLGGGALDFNAHGGQEMIL